MENSIPSYHIPPIAKSEREKEKGKKKKEIV
jgi:hypothetical protein